VLYLAGWGRSGSTLAEAMLDQHPELIGVGEIKFLWERGLRQNRRCSCGTPIRSCPFWVRVLREAFGAMPDDDRVDDLDAASRRFRTRHLPQLLLTWPRRLFAPDLDWYYHDLGALYDAVQRVSGARVIVDSSKFPPYLVALLQTPGLDVRVAHLVRDPRAVAHSWQRRVADPDAPGDAMMPQLHPGVTALYWSAWNLATERIATRAAIPYLRFRYEDLVADPAATLEQLAELVDLPSIAPPVNADGELLLAHTHQVSGNPSRLRSGAIPLRLDDAWVDDMPAFDRRLAGAFTMPLRQRYGYGRAGSHTGTRQ
jgi:hypothetical protein